MEKRAATEQLVRWSAVCVLVFFGVLTVWAGLRYLTGGVMPVLIGYGLAAWIRAMGRFAGRFTGDRKLRLGPVGERIGGITLAAVLCVVLGWGGYRGITVLAGQAGELMERAAEFGSWDALPYWLREKIPPGLQEQIGSWVTALVEKGAGWLASAAGGVISALPGAALGLFVTTASVFYWLVDRDGILADLARLVPGWMKESRWFGSVREKAKKTLPAVGRYIRAQLSVAAVVFALLLTGFALLEVPAPAAWACLTALVDLLPLFGAGVILIPWAVFAFLTGRTGFGAGLAVLWLACWLLRQWMEPKVLGKMFGVHPYVMLAGMYLGLKLAGITGVLAVVVTLLMLRGGGD